jgi:hypothetical protein
MQPRVASIVHYKSVAFGSCMAAMVTGAGGEQGDSSVSLVIFYPPFTNHVPEGMLVAVPQDEDQADHVSGTWHWPESAG